jgi:hypothetical protein
MELVLPMKPSPIADHYVTADQLHIRQEPFPLDLYLCLSCGHVQNLDVVDPELLFRDYHFLTSGSSGLVEHFRAYANEIVRTFGTPTGTLAVEIGSNDGTFLRFLKAHGMRVLGVDPAQAIAAEADRQGIPTLPEFFTESLAERIVAEHGNAEIVAANNVFAHTDCLADVAAGIRTLLSDTGVFVFEASYLADIVDRFLFDTVYHEHVSYHSIKPLVQFFDSIGLQLFDIWRNSSKGGSIRGFVQRKQPGARPPQAIVTQLEQEEVAQGLNRPEIFRRYARDIAARKQALLALLDAAKLKGERIAGYGASTTVTTLLYQFELNDRLDFLVDDNPRKQQRYSPGAHIAVLPSSELYVRKPNLCLILAWNYASTIIERNRRFIDCGGRFVVPLPELRVVAERG